MPALLVGTDDGLHSLDYGVDVFLRRERVTSLAQDGTGWWAVSDQRSLWHTDGESGWSRSLVLQREVVTSILPTATGLLIGTEGARLVRLDGHDLEPVTSFDDLPGRLRWTTPWGGPPSTRSLTADFESNVYAAVHVGGIMRSGDGGRTWEDTAFAPDDDVHEVTTDAAGTVYAACAKGLAVSADGGETWEIRSDGLDRTYCRAVTLAGDHVLVSASGGPNGRRAAVYRAPASGGAFAKCEEGLPKWFRGNVDTGCLSGLGPVAAFGGPDGTVYLSADEGVRWAHVSVGLPPIRCLAVA